MGLLVGACGGEPAPEPDAPSALQSQGDEASDSTTESVDSTTEPAASEPAAPPSDPEPLGRCHISCCSARVLELQAQSDDPSIQNECCFCGEE